MNLNVSARLATGVVGALLGVMLLGSGMVAAQSTRIVCFRGGWPNAPAGGSTGCSLVDSSTGAITPGTLSFSPVTVGGNTAVKVQIRNDSGSTLNHVKFAGGDIADNLAYNPGFPNPYLPGTTSFPGTATVAGIFPTAGCTFSKGNLGFLCDVGSLAANASANYTVVITPPASGGPVWLTASWNEGWSTTGSNADYTFAAGSITVSAQNCGNGTSNYFLPGQGVGLTDGGCANQTNQSSSVNSGGKLDAKGQGGFGSLIDDGSFAVACPIAKVTCTGDTVTASVLGGTAVPGGLQWTITWYGIKQLTGVIHFLYDSSGNYIGFVPIYLTKSYQCSATRTTDCWVSPITTSKGNVSPSWISVTFITASNGKAGGFI